jgi:8-oxo-dGTP diphosphatase
MPGRAPASRRPLAGEVALDLVCCAVRSGRLMVLVVPGARGGRGATGTLPWTRAPADEALDAAAHAAFRERLGRAPAWMGQVGAFATEGRHPARRAAVSVLYAAVVPEGTEAPEGLAWLPVREPPPLPPGRQVVLDAAIAMLRDRMDLAPIAFRLLPARFTLSELQRVYELLLGRRLHKASFRRTLQAAFLVEPTDEWRSEGRGRPAQLFRYAPRRRRGARRPVRFELLG